MGFRGTPAGAAAGAAAAGALATDAADADADAGGVVIGRRPGPETVLRPRFLSAAAATFDEDFLRAAATACTAWAAAATRGRRAW